MKVLIRNKKWEISFKKVMLISEVTGHHKDFNIKFSYCGKEVIIKSNNLDKTFKCLEDMFDRIEDTKIPAEYRIN